MKEVIFLTVFIATFVVANAAKLGTTPCQRQEDCPTEECCIYRGARRNGTCGPAIKEGERCKMNYIMIGGKNLLRCSCQRDLTCKTVEEPDVRGRMRKQDKCVRGGDVVVTTAQPEEVTTTAQPEEVTTTAQPEEVTTTAQPEEGTTTAQPEEGTTTEQPEEGTTTEQPEEQTTAVETTAVPEVTTEPAVPGEDEVPGGN